MEAKHTLRVLLDAVTLMTSMLCWTTPRIWVGKRAVEA